MNIKRSALKNSATAVALLVVGIAVGLLLLAFVYIMPKWWVDYHIGESIWGLKDEGDYTRVETGEQIDNFSDALMLNMLYNKAGSFEDDMLLGQYVAGDIFSPVQNLFDYMTKGMDDSLHAVSYPRFWHGYQVVLAPLFLFFNITEIRTFNMLMQLMLIMVLVAVLAGRKRTDMIVPFMTMYFALAPLALFSSFMFSTTFYVMCFLLITIAIKHNKWSFAKICYSFEAAGIAVAFLDFISYPAASLGVPMIMYFSLDASERKKLRERIKEFALLCLSWGIGYFGMWAGKWIVATIMTDENVILNALSAIKVRSSTRYGEQALTYMGTVSKNVGHLINSGNGLFLYVVLAMVIVWGIWMLKKKGASLNANVATVAIILLSCFIPLGWYLISINHSYVHSWFTYRELVVTVYGVMSVLYLGLYRKQELNKEENDT